MHIISTILSKYRRFRCYIELCFRGIVPHIYIELSNKNIFIKARKGYQTRTLNTLGLILEALARADSTNKVILKERYRIFWCDYVSSLSARIWNFFPGKNFAYSAYKSDIRASRIELIPDFIFNAWPEVYIPDYEKKCEEIIKASQKTPLYQNRVFWAGNVDTHESRKILEKYSKIYSWIDVYNSSNSSSNKNYNKDLFVSLEDHCKYQFLIDLRGVGYSGRVKLLLFSGRCLFLQDREFEEWYYSHLKPFVHFIPIKDDLSDLNDKYYWALNNSRKVDQIAKNAQEFAIKYLTKNTAIEFILRKISSN